MGACCGKGSAVKDPDKAPYGAPPPKGDGPKDKAPMPEPRSSKVKDDRPPSEEIPDEHTDQKSQEPLNKAPVPIPRQNVPSPVTPSAAPADRAPTPPPILVESQPLKKADRVPAIPTRDYNKSPPVREDSETGLSKSVPVEEDEAEDKPELKPDDVKLEIKEDRKFELTSSVSKSQYEYKQQEVKSSGFASYNLSQPGKGPQDIDSLIKSFKEKGLETSITSSRTVSAKKTLIIEDGSNPPVVKEAQVTTKEVVKDGELLLSEKHEHERSSDDSPSGVKIKNAVSIPEVQAKFQVSQPSDAAKLEKVVVTKTTISLDEASSPIEKKPSPTTPTSPTSRVPVYNREGSIPSPLKSPTSSTFKESPSTEVHIEKKEITVEGDGEVVETKSPVVANVLIMNGTEKKEEIETRQNHSTSISSYVSVESEETAELHESIIQTNRKNAIKKLLPDFAWANTMIQKRHKYQANTRARLQSCLDKWISGQEKENTCTLRMIWGQPGMGKTCLATDLCSRHASRIAAKHFFDFCTPNMDHNDPCSVVMSLAYQLCDFYPDYLNMLPKPDDLEGLIDKRELRELWQALILDPLNAISVDDAKPALIILDSLEDSCLHHQEVFFELLNKFDETTPEWILLLVTVNDNNQIKTQLEKSYSIELKNAQDNLMDIKRYLKDYLSPFMDRISLDGGLTQLAKQTEGSFLCAYLFARNCLSLPKGKQIALREIGTMFPTGLQSSYTEVFQHFLDCLADNSTEQQAKDIYETVLGILMNVQEPIHVDALAAVVSLDVNIIIEGLKPVIIRTDDDCIMLHHAFVRDWLWKEADSGPLAVNDAVGKQKLQECCTKWLGEINGNSKAAKLSPQLVNYALKHSIFHLTDVPRQQENVARLLCSLQYIQQKVSLEHVNIHHLFNDYQHLHFQIMREPVKMITLQEYMKRQPKLMEQIESFFKFVQQNGAEIEQDPQFTMHIAANYPNFDRIQKNARLDLASRTWIEDCTTMKETPCIAKNFNGDICAVDVSGDHKMIALITKDQKYNLHLHLLNLANGHYKIDPVNIKGIKDRVGVCVKFVKDTTNIFVGSLSTMVTTKGKEVPSGFNLNSIKMKEKFSIECCDISSKVLATGVSTFPWGGRSLHMLMFDLKGKQCSQTLEVLKFRFGGSAQFGIRSCALSADSTLLCTCVKQTNKDQLKATVWKTSNVTALHSVDINGDTFTKCLFLGSHVLLGGSIHFVNQENRGCTIKSQLWDYKTNKVELLSEMEHHSILCAQNSNQLVYTNWIAPKGPANIKFLENSEVKPGETVYRIYGLDNVQDMLSCDQYFVYFSSDELKLYHTNDMETPKQEMKSNATVNDISIQSLNFLPKTDMLLLSHCEPFSQNGKMSVSLLDLKQEEPKLTATPFTDETQPSGTDTAGSFTYFTGIGSTQPACACTPDGNLVVVNNGSQVKVWNRTNGNISALPTYDELPSKPDSSSSHKGLICAVSPKDFIAALVYSQQPNTVYLYDLRTKQSQQQVKLHAEEGSPTVTDFAFLIHNGNLMTYHRDAMNTLAVWNQRTAEQINMVQCVSIAYLKSSPASDRVAISIRRRQLEGELILTNSDGRFNVILDMPETWLPASNHSDAAFSPDGTILLGVASQNGICRVWNAGNGEVLQDIDISLGSVSYIPGMLTNTHALLYDGRLIAVDIASLEVQAVLPLKETMMGRSSPNSLTISTKGNYVVGATDQGQVKIFLCHNFAPIKWKTTLQRMKSVTK